MNNNDQSNEASATETSAEGSDEGIDGLLDRLEGIVVQLEKGELPLEAALMQFEEGVGLANKASTVLQQAEMRVDKLIRERGQLTTAALDDGG